MLKINIQDDGLTLEVRVQPKAASDRIAGLHGEALKVAVTAAADRGKANRALIALLAEKLGLKKQNISIISGRSSRSKILKISGCDQKELQKLIAGNRKD